MRIVLLLLCLILSPLSATYILISEKKLTVDQQKKLFNLLIRQEPPRVFYTSTPLDLHSECARIATSTRLEWIPPMLWQLGALHAFFHDQKIKDRILAIEGYKWDPLNLASLKNLEDLAERFDHSLPRLYDLFFQVNTAVKILYERANSDDVKMLHLAISELPPFEKWRENRFPFTDLAAAQRLYHALQDEPFLLELLKLEKNAHKKGEWVLYRGYPGFGFPSTLEIGGSESHALSFGSTLLGGTFFSLSATALTYSKIDSPRTFLALRITPKEMKELFRLGPLHPFIQMIADGEMFHMHTKVAASRCDEYQNKPLKGYFLPCNQQCVDTIGYVLKLKTTPLELEQAFHKVCERSGHIFSNPYKEK